MRGGHVDLSGAAAASVAGADAARCLAGAGVVVISAREADLGAILAATGTLPLCGIGPERLVGASVNGLIPRAIAAVHDAMIRCDAQQAVPRYMP